MLAISDGLALALLEQKKVTKADYGLRHHGGYLGTAARDEKKYSGRDRTLLGIEIKNPAIFVFSKTVSLEKTLRYITAAINLRTTFCFSNAHRVF